MKNRKNTPDCFTAWVNSKVSYLKQKNILCSLIGCLVALIFCRGCGNYNIEPKIEFVEVPVEKIVYQEAQKQYETEALQVARVL